MLVDQILNFPKAKHDDLLDALKDILLVMYPGVEVREKKSSGLSPNEELAWKELDKYTEGRRRVRRT